MTNQNLILPATLFFRLVPGAAFAFRAASLYGERGLLFLGDETWNR